MLLIQHNLYSTLNQRCIFNVESTLNTCWSTSQPKINIDSILIQHYVPAGIPVRWRSAFILHVPLAKCSSQWDVKNILYHLHAKSNWLTLYFIFCMRLFMNSYSMPDYYAMIWLNITYVIGKHEDRKTKSYWFTSRMKQS